MVSIEQYINSNWDRTIRIGTGGRADVFPLPRPYTVPCINGHFQAFYYWDTYFTNLGLIRQGRIGVALDNAENMFHLVGTHGYVPNQTYVGQDNRSQPPYLSMVVRELYEVTGDRDFLSRALPIVEREYRFWMKDRLTPIGLNRHGHNATDDYLVEFYQGALVPRLGFGDLPRAEKVRHSHHFLAEAETGWDFNPRFAGRCADHAAVDLNANLFAYEQNFASLAGELGLDSTGQWQDAAAARRDLLNRYSWDDERGLYLDYDCAEQRRSPVASLATFHPLWVGLASPEQAERVERSLGLFEREHGIAVCEPGARDREYQWDFPNLWPPLVYTTVNGLLRYGLKDSARRVARKFRAIVEHNFSLSGQLWEKYDVRSAAVAGGEYPAQDMLGWTAGVYLALEAAAAG